MSVKIDKISSVCIIVVSLVRVSLRPVFLRNANIKNCQVKSRQSLCNEISNVEAFKMRGSQFSCFFFASHLITNCFS